MAMPRPRILLVASALLLAVLVAACGDDEREGSFTSESGTGTETTATGTETTTTPAAEASKTFQISEVEFKLRPADFTLAEPGVVEFVVKNEGGTVHALEIEGPSGEFETEEIQPGGEARLTAELGQDGTYKLYCPVGDHEGRGMVGKLVVGGKSGSGSGDSGDDSGGGGGSGETGGTSPDDDSGGGGGSGETGGTSPGDSGSDDSGGDGSGGPANPDPAY